MVIRLLTITLYLEGCHSLKEKRQRLAGLKSRLGRESYIAIKESQHQELTQSAEWSILVLADHLAQADQYCNDIESAILENLDARITEFHSEIL